MSHVAVSLHLSGLYSSFSTFRFFQTFKLEASQKAQERAAQQQPAAGRRHDEPPDGDIPAARMPRTPGTAPSGTFGGGPEKRCAGRARPRAARSAWRRILK